MNIHFCTKNPCPVQDKEIHDQINSGWGTSYTFGATEESVLSGLAKWQRKRRRGWLVFFAVVCLILLIWWI